MSYRAAIVGRAATTALGADLATTWARFGAGDSALAPWPSRAGWAGNVPWCARVPDARVGPVEDPALRLLGRHGEWLDLVAHGAHGQAGLGALAREEVGIYSALGMVDSPPEELAPAVLASRDGDGEFDLERFLSGGFRALHPLWPLSMLGNVAVGQVATGLDIRGDNVVLASDACAGVRVLLEAQRALETGVARAALAGGAAEPVTEASLARRQFAGAALVPPTLGGEVVLLGPGEGAAMLALEAPASARARGVPVLGWLGAIVTRQAGGSPAAAAAEASLAALQAAGFAPTELDLVILCATPLPGGRTIVRGAPAQDHGAEGLIGALLATGARPQFVSLAGALGDLLGAGPALAAALALEMFAAGAPPSARTTRIEMVGEQVARRAPRRALVVVCAPAETGCGAFVVEAPACVS